MGLLLSGLLLAACAPPRPATPAVELPPLRLAPAALGQELSLQQKLHFRHGSRQRELDALLEVDATEVRLAVEALGQSGVRLQWNGATLQQQRAAWLPAMVRGERVLDDLQFTLWPVAAMQAVLPPGWSVDEKDGVRRLIHDGKAWLIATYIDDSHVRLQNLAEGYDLEIESAAEGAGNP